MHYQSEDEPTFTITAVGDICLSDHLLCYGFGVASKIEKYGSQYIFSQIKNRLCGSDIVFGNLECVLSTIGADNDNIRSMLFRGRPEYISVLKAGAFNILNLANNHAMDHGLNVFNDTKKQLIDNSIHPLGLKAQGRFNSQPVIFQKDKKRLAFLGYSFNKDKTPDHRVAYAKGDLARIANDIELLKHDTDYIVISCHWGLELMNRPSNHTIKLARDLIDSGADVILGHHSHTLQGVEEYKGKLIIYSLGNFVFDLHWDLQTRKTGIFRIHINSENIQYDFTPVFINDKYQPQIVSETKNLPEINETINPSHDIEHVNLSYYLEYKIHEQRLFFKKIVFLIKNLYRIRKNALLFLLKTKLLSK